MSTIPGSFGASHPQSVPEINQPPEPSPGRALIARVWGPEGGHFPTEREVRRFTALFRYHEIPEDNEKACQNFCREYRLCFPLTEKADPEAVAAFLDRLIDGIPALCKAIEHDDHEAVAALLDAGATIALPTSTIAASLPHQPDRSPRERDVIFNNALALAIDRYWTPEQIKPLIEAGKRQCAHPGALNCLDIGHWRIRIPLFAAGWRNDTALIKLLVESGASVSPTRDGWSPLAAAVGSGDAEAVMMLLDHGAPTDPKNWNGDEWETLADLAIRHRQYDLADLLLKKGYQPSDRQVTEWISWGDLKRVASLVDNGFDLGEMEAKLILAEIEDPRGWPASTSLIHYALECSDSDTRNKMIELLVANGARVKEIPNYVPQVEAIRRGQKDSAALLVKLGADPNERLGQLLSPEHGGRER
jgi:hypothetical protein